VLQLSGVQAQLPAVHAWPAAPLQRLTARDRSRADPSDYLSILAVDGCTIPRPALGDDQGSGRGGRHDRFAHRQWRGAGFYFHELVEVLQAAGDEPPNPAAIGAVTLRHGLTPAPQPQP
jgi:hypothetical protein